jgi:Holliday junction resolvase-like predicted endonuclease
VLLQADGLTYADTKAAATIILSYNQRKSEGREETMRKEDKSSRHSKIIGEFGENMICNWLSRKGFEIALVDHTGIDVVAYNPKTEQRYGISVKSRARVEGKENEGVFIFNQVERDRRKLREACESFACDQWIAVYVETSDSADLYLTSLDNYDEKYADKHTKTQSWKMSEDERQKYDNDTEVKHIKIDFHCTHWDW